MKKNASIMTLGCRLNQADSALIAGRLERMDIELKPYSTDEPRDILIVNSCAVTASASRKSRQLLRQLRSKHPESFLILTGCSAEADPSFTAKTEGIDLILSNENKKELELRLSEFLQRKETDANSGSTDEMHHTFVEKAFSSYPFKSRANLKVQEGCDNFCSYCIVPYTRGRERSRDFDETLDDFRRLLDSGFREITLTGVNICRYSCGGRNLIDLLETLAAQPGTFRLRLGSIEPGTILGDVLKLMADSDGKICEFMHPSLQHGSDTVLKLMNRHYLTAEYRDFVRKARTLVPHIHIGTDVIAGFPGETDALFEESLDFIREMKFSNMHIFPFSPREGTPAAKMVPQVPNAIAEHRAEILRELAEKMKAEYHESLLNTIQTVIPEESADGIGEGWTGNYVRCRFPLNGAPCGEIFKVRITGLETGGILRGEPESFIEKQR